MQKVGPLVLLFMLVFALVFALLPTGDQTTKQTGATLQGVSLALYPTRDPDAIWQFRAEKVTNDPLTSTTVLSGLSGGERLVREKTPQGLYTGRTKVDATISTPLLTIDGQDNLLMDRVNMHLVQRCADISLRARGQELVRIEQANGFSAPLADMSSPNLNGHVERLRMSFGFFFLEGADPDRSHFTYDLDNAVRCVNGQRVQAS